MKITNSLTYDRSKLLVEISTSLIVFNLFFDESTFLKLINNINRFAKLHSIEKIEKEKQKS